VKQKFSLLCPRPRKLEAAAGELCLPRGSRGQRPRVELVDCEDTPAAGRLRGLLEETNLLVDATGATRFRLQLIDGDRTSQAYTLSVDTAGVDIAASSAAGLFYGVCSLAQLVKLGKTEATITLPLLRIADQPSFARRGVMLDISRDKVPTLETTLGLVELLASLKINELQLYMEHTFAYAGHEQVWEKASPFTGAEIETLDRFCRERHVELVPNQNSFGHMQRWLSLQPYRSDLAEAPDGFEHAWNPTREPYGLCPTDAKSLAFLNGLYDQLLPHFTSRIFNVGLDETFDLGLGRSKQACQERGTERVYLEFLQQIHETVSRRGFAMQFWGDIIIKRPELIPELPKDAIAMEWGYEHDHPFAENVVKFAAAGLRFYVCPGTSSWNTIGFLAGAAMSWKAEDAQAPLELPVAEWLDALVLDDRAERLGKVARDLGNAYRELGVRSHNSSALFFFVAGRPGQPLELSGIEPGHFDQTLAYLQRLDVELAAARPGDAESRAVQEELGWASDLLKVACRIGKARLALGLAQPLVRLDPALRETLAAELGPLVQRHRELWLRRNRPGGLVDSVAHLQRVLAQLRA